MFQISREVYTVLGFLRDVGGLLGALNGIFNGIAFVLTFNGLYQLLTSRLYRVDSASGSYKPGQTILQRVLERERHESKIEKMDKKKGISQYQDIHWSVFSSFTLNIKRFIP